MFKFFMDHLHILVLKCPTLLWREKELQIIVNPLSSGEWEFSINRSSSTSRAESRPKSNPHQESNFLSIEEAFDKAMSLPSSPVRKEPAESFDALDQLSRLVGKTTRQTVQTKKTTVAKKVEVKEQPRQVK